MKLIKLIVSSLIFFIVLLLLAYSLRITEIECQIDTIKCPDHLLVNLNKLKSKSLLFINIEKELSKDSIETEIYSYNSFSKSFPGTLKLDFKEESVLYELEYQDQRYFVGEFGSILLSNQNNNDLPIMIWSQKNNSLIQDTAINNNAHQKLAKIALINKEDNLKIKEVVYIDFDEINIFMQDISKIIIDEEGINTKLESLILIKNSPEIKDFEEPILEIDLRFSLPVLRTRQ